MFEKKYENRTHASKANTSEERKRGNTSAKNILDNNRNVHNVVIEM